MQNNVKLQEVERRYFFVLNNHFFRYFVQKYPRIINIFHKTIAN